MAKTGNVRSLRTFYKGTAGAAWTDHNIVDDIAAGTQTKWWCSHCIISNDGANTLEFSWDNGTTVHGELLAGEVIEFEDIYENQISLQRSGPVDVAYRVWAW